MQISWTDMRIRTIRYSSHFVRSLKRIGSEYRSLVEEHQKIFQANCFDPKLKMHKLHGRLEGYWSFSLTHAHRVLFVFSGRDRVDFIDVGDHSIYE